MTDQELADAIVALGIETVAMKGKMFDYDSPEHIERFVRDWRVTGALMEKCKDRSGNYYFGILWDQAAIQFTDGPLSRAITEACATWLTEQSSNDN